MLTAVLYTNTKARLGAAKYADVPGMRLADWTEGALDNLLGLRSAEQVIAAALCARGCSPMYPRLQPYVPKAAALCARGCSPMCPRLQPYVPEAAALCARGCSPMCPRLQP